MAARHHTVPQFYLRNFTDDAGQVMLMSRDSPHRTFRTSAKNAVAETGFYRIETDDLVREEDRATFDPESIEAALSEVETAMAPAIQRLVEDHSGVVDTATWYQLIQFTAVQTVRGHRWRNDFAAMATQSMRTRVLEIGAQEKARLWLAAQGRSNQPADVAAFLDSVFSSRFPQVVPPQAVLVQESLKMALGNPDTNDVGLGQYLAKKKLDLIVPKRAIVLTSDEPVCWWSPGGGPVGYATAKVVWVPLSPQLIAQFCEPTFDLTAHNFPDIRSSEGHDEIVAVVNRLVAAQAERWIVLRPGDAPIEQMDLPPREIWGDEQLAVHEEDERTRRELRVYRRLRPDA